jgi:hypothetical protein
MVAGGKDQTVTDDTIVKRDLHEEPNISGSTNFDPNATPAPETNNPAIRRDRETAVPLFGGDESRNLRSRWESLQVGFVDEPRHSVEQADQLVTEAINSLSKGFSSQRERLEQQWHRDQDVSTEELRLAFRRYRSFFERLLSM